MNREEIKHSYSMREIAERYGFHVNRAGFIHCPFHKGDKGASLKIYQTASIVSDAEQAEISYIRATD